LSPEDHVRGARESGLALIEYGDYQCPFCGQAELELQRVRAELEAQVAFVFRNFPITQAHPHALQAAEAAESAGAQSRFWEMHDLLYANQHRLDEDSLYGFAKALRLDLDQFAQDLDGHRFVAKIRREFMEGVRSGVNGTPSFFINGVRYQGDYSAEGLIDALKAAMPGELHV